MISVQKLCKNYASRQALVDVSFEVGRGEIVGFLGPNGAGKTTTMKILTGYMQASSGEVAIDGKLISDHPIEIKQRLGYLPEVPPLYMDMHVRAYLEYVARLKFCEPKALASLVDAALEKTGLKQVSSRLISNLSKGFKQRVGLAQALVSNPDILILDEPTVGLDPRQVIEIRELLASLKGQHTIILSSHILSEVQISCDRVIIINQGRIVEKSSLKDLGKNLQARQKLSLQVRNLEGLVEKLRAMPEVLEARASKNQVELEISSEKEINDKVAELVVSGGHGLMELKKPSLDLEDAYISLTEKGNKS